MRLVWFLFRVGWRIHNQKPADGGSGSKVAVLCPTYRYITRLRYGVRNLASTASGRTHVASDIFFATRSEQLALTHAVAAIHQSCDSAIPGGLMNYEDSFAELR